MDTNTDLGKSLDKEVSDFKTLPGLLTLGFDGKVKSFITFHYLRFIMISKTHMLQTASFKPTNHRIIVQ